MDRLRSWVTTNVLSKAGQSGMKAYCRYSPRDNKQQSGCPEGGDPDPVITTLNYRFPSPELFSPLASQHLLVVFKGPFLLLD